MRVRVIVEVVDEEERRGTRRRQEVDIPSKVLNVHSVLYENREELRKFIADDVMSGALAAVSKPQGVTESLDKAFFEESVKAPRPVRVNARNKVQNCPTGTSPQQTLSKMESLLGLDVINHIDGLEAQGRRAQKIQKEQMNTEVAKAESAPSLGFNWGPIGFGSDRER